MRHLLIITATMILMLANEARAADKWTATDTTLETTFAVLMLVDRNQTMENEAMPEIGWARTFIGSHPSRGRVNTYFVTATALHAAGAYALRKLTGSNALVAGWQSVFIGVEVSVIHANMQAGLHVSLRF